MGKKQNTKTKKDTQETQEEPEEFVAEKVLYATYVSTVSAYFYSFSEDFKHDLKTF